MTYEPRVRGNRFGRPARKKAAKEKNDEVTKEVYFPEAVPKADASETAFKTLNAINHLGSQRFPLPPYAEHFQRWFRDLQTATAEFEDSLPEAADAAYQDAVQKVFVEIQRGLEQRIQAENTIVNDTSELERRLRGTELSLSKLEHEHGSRTREVRKEHENSFATFRNEIARLDKRRVKLLQRKPSLLQRLVGGGDRRIEANAEAIRNKKETLSQANESMKKSLDKIREEYEAKRQILRQEQLSLRDKLVAIRNQNADDAVEIRKQTCEELSRAISDATARAKAAQPPNTEVKTDLQ